MPLYFIITRRQHDIASGKGTHWVGTWVCHFLAVWHWASSILQTLVFLFCKIEAGSLDCSKLGDKIYGNGKLWRKVSFSPLRAKHNCFLKLLFKFLKGNSLLAPPGPCDCPQSGSIALAICRTASCLGPGPQNGASLAVHCPTAAQRHILCLCNSVSCALAAWSVIRKQKLFPWCWAIN